MDKPMYPELVKLVNDAIKSNTQYELAIQLYRALDMLDADIRMKAMRAYSAWKRKMSAPYRKAVKDKIKAYFDGLSIEEQIDFVNKDYEDLPEEIKELDPKIIKVPGCNNFVRLGDLVSPKERQRENTGARILRIMRKKGLTTTNEEGKVVPHYDRFEEIISEVMEKYDLPATKTHKGQRTRVTAQNMKSYIQERVNPKQDKITAIALATNTPVWYVSGYLGDDPDIMSKEPFSAAPDYKPYRKPRKKPTPFDKAAESA